MDSEEDIQNFCEAIKDLCGDYSDTIYGDTIVNALITSALSIVYFGQHSQSRDQRSNWAKLVTKEAIEFFESEYEMRNKE